MDSTGILKKELYHYDQEGITYSLNGRRCSAFDILHAHQCAEEDTFMRDYLSDPTGRIRKINFTKVKKEKS